MVLRLPSWVFVTGLRPAEAGREVFPRGFDFLMLRSQQTSLCLGITRLLEKNLHCRWVEKGFGAWKRSLRLVEKTVSSPNQSLRLGCWRLCWLNLSLRLWRRRLHGPNRSLGWRRRRLHGLNLSLRLCLKRLHYLNLSVRFWAKKAVSALIFKGLKVLKSTKKPLSWQSKERTLKQGGKPVMNLLCRDDGGGWKDVKARWLSSGCQELEPEGSGDVSPGSSQR